MSLFGLPQVMHAQHPLIHAVAKEHDGQHGDAYEGHNGDCGYYCFSIHWMIFLSGLNILVVWSEEIFFIRMQAILVRLFGMRSARAECTIKLP
jgi:hypothetical protein